MISRRERDDLRMDYHRALNGVNAAIRILEDTATQAEKVTGRFGGNCPANLINELYEAFASISKAQVKIREAPAAD
ncbi:MAG TPA: hypothetical protein VG247_01130 [Pseudonocardiaceae bacterium]|jgi:hypothetical protein|nr:hypothetical protein [Pseudonocardiaceae bacterium]